MKFIILLLLIFSAISKADVTKVGYINLDHIISSSPQYIKLIQDIKKEFKSEQDELLKLEKEISSAVGNFNKNQEKMSEEKARSEFQKIKDLENKFIEKREMLQKRQDLKEQNGVNEILSQINIIIKDIAKKNNFDLVLYQKVAYVNEKINITSEISEKLRLSFK
jgi:outer membrane protein